MCIMIIDDIIASLAILVMIITIANIIKTHNKMKFGAVNGRTQYNKIIFYSGIIIICTIILVEITELIPGLDIFGLAGLLVLIGLSFKLFRDGTMYRLHNKRKE